MPFWNTQMKWQVCRMCADEMTNSHATSCGVFQTQVSSKIIFLLRALRATVHTLWILCHLWSKMKDSVGELQCQRVFCLNSLEGRVPLSPPFPSCVEGGDKVTFHCVQTPQVHWQRRIFHLFATPHVECGWTQVHKHGNDPVFVWNFCCADEQQHEEWQAWGFAEEWLMGQERKPETVTKWGWSRKDSLWTWAWVTDAATTNVVAACTEPILLVFSWEAQEVQSVWNLLKLTQWQVLCDPPWIFHPQHL